MNKLDLSLACWDYDRTAALREGTVNASGIRLTCISKPVEEVFFRMLRYREFDVAEMSLSSYVVSLNTEDPPFVAIPVFLSRFFRHSSIYINAGAGIAEPRDLIGKRIGVPEFQMTAPVWIRGILADEYDVPVDSVTYFTGGEEQPGRTEKLKLNLPPNIQVRAIPTDKTLSTMLKEGEIDALYTARKPSTFGDGVERLFQDYKEVEKNYFRSTGIFPIMHVVAIRREVYQKNRWIARSIFDAFCEAQAKTYQDFRETAALKTMLPWLTAYVEETARLMGDDFWPYGLDKNRGVIETFLRYHHDQGLSARLFSPEEIFAPETLEGFLI